MFDNGGRLLIMNAIICPVCGIQKVDGNNGISCDVCGFEYAYVHRFNSGLGREYIVDKGIKKKKAAEERMPIRQRAWNSFTITGKGAAFITRYDNRLIYEGGGTFKGNKENVIQFSSSEKHMAVLYKDGTVYAEGANDYGQIDVENMKNIKFICCSANCTYGIDEVGRVVYAGAIADRSIASWTGIKKIVSSEKYTVAITVNNDVYAYGGIPDPFLVDVGKVIDVAVMGSVALFLKEDGKVVIFGNTINYKDIVSSWSNIVAIALDNLFIYGLTADGRIVVAGKCKNEFLDKGRSAASKEENVVAISACKSGFGALKRDGTLFVAGSIDRSISEKINSHNREIVKNLYGDWN